MVYQLNLFCWGSWKFFKRFKNKIRFLPRFTIPAISRWPPCPLSMLVLIVARSSSAFQSILSGGTGERMFIVWGSGQGAKIVATHGIKMVMMGKSPKFVFAWNTVCQRFVNSWVKQFNRFWFYTLRTSCSPMGVMLLSLFTRTSPPPWVLWTKSQAYNSDLNPQPLLF